MTNPTTYIAGLSDELIAELVELGSLVRLADGSVVDPFAPSAAALAGEARQYLGGLK